MRSNRILVTGASGMIGRALVQRLRADCISVSAVGGKPNDNAEINHYWQLGKGLGAALDGVSTLVHLAARVHVRGAGFSDMEGFVRDNADHTLQLAKEAYARGARRFVFASSIGVLGANASSPLNETAVPRPHNAYTSSKHIAEQLLGELSEFTGMELVILRFPAVVGAGVKGNVGSLVRVIQRQFPLPFSLLKNQRQFVTLQDLVAGILLAATHENAAGQIFHLANPERVSTLDLCQMIASELGVTLRSWPLPPTFLRAAFIGVGRRSLADGLTADMLVDTAKISSMLGWKTNQSIRSALREVLSSHN